MPLPEVRGGPALQRLQALHNRGCTLQLQALLVHAVLFSHEFGDAAFDFIVASHAPLDLMPAPQQVEMALLALRFEGHCDTRACSLD